MAISWLLTHTAFALRYAHLYYREDEEGQGSGVVNAGGGAATGVSNAGGNAGGNGKGNSGGNGKGKGGG